MLELLKKIFELIKEFFAKSDEPVKLPSTEERPALPAQPPTTEKKCLLRLINTGLTNSSGLKVLRLHYIVDEKVVAHVNVVSGAPGRQNFRQGWESKAGSLEPIPEGYYALGPVEWAEGKKNNYSTTWGPGLGPVWIGLTPKMKTARSALGIHLDENQATSPGTAGCIGIPTKEELARVVMWFEDPKTRPSQLTVNYGLGSVETQGNGIEAHFQQSPNYNPFREIKVDTIILHNTEGSTYSAVARFMNSAEQVSAHYIVGRDAKLIQMVKEEHTAWHSGNRATNHRSIGIEIEAGANVGQGMTEAQEKTLIILVKNIMKNHNILVSRVLPHRTIVATNCPGSIWKTDADLAAWKEKHLA